jgi:hypothetical protein
MIRKIVQVPINKFNAVETFTVPEDSYLLSVENIHDKPVLFFVQPADPKKVDGKRLTTQIDILSIHGEEPWSDVVGDDLQLNYIGAAICDAGYRVFHVFEILEAEEEFEEYTEEDFKTLVNTLKEETPEIPTVQINTNIVQTEPKIEIEEGGEVKAGILTYTEK